MELPYRRLSILQTANLNQREVILYDADLYAVPLQDVEVKWSNSNFKTKIEGIKLKVK